MGISNPIIRQAFNHRSLSGFGGLAPFRGLGATVNQCEEWRKAAAWITPGLTDEQRRVASQSWNDQCRNTVAATAATAATAIQSGSGAKETSEVNQYETQPTRFTAQQKAMAEAEAWLRSHTRPGSCGWSPSDLVPVPECGPLDGECLQCSYQLQQTNAALLQNVKNECNREGCEYDKMRNIAATGKPSTRNCAAEFPLATVPPASCAVKFGGGYVSPAATVDPSGKVVVDDTGASFYTLLPKAEQTAQMSQVARQTTAGVNQYTGDPNNVVPFPTSGAGTQPGVVDTGAETGTGTGTGAGAGEGLLGGMSTSTLLLAAAAVVALIVVSK